MILLIDDILPKPTMEALKIECEHALTSKELVSYNNPHERKFSLDRIHYKHGFLTDMHAKVDRVATQVLRRMFKCQTVFNDLTGRGCGLHVLPTDGYLDLHYDGNWHPTLNLRRFANMVFYVAGGPSDFIYEDLSIPFRPNRMVLFTTTKNEIHGVPKPVSIPRYTLSSFFYIDGPKPEHIHRAVFVNADESFKTKRSAL